jgi:hypothetical protein
MSWNILKLRTQRKGHGPDDDLQVVINRIEKFAPKQHLGEREMYYYHYRQINKYFKPLLALLVDISEQAERGNDRAALVQGLFVKLKDFYDIHDTLSMKQAVGDYSLKVKLLTLLKIFYNDTTLAGGELDNYLERIAGT